MQCDMEAYGEQNKIIKIIAKTFKKPSKLLKITMRIWVKLITNSVKAPEKQEKVMIVITNS